MKLVVLTGAGISAESGLRTFRGNDGLWENEPIEAVATPEGYFRDKKRVKDFYNKLRVSLPKFQPNAAHIALAKLEERLGDDFLLITQNVDDLHERAGSKRVLHMHGYLNELRCEKNEEHIFPFTGEETMQTKCPICGAMSRPHIVWFGEIPLFMDTIEHALQTTAEFVYIGTSSVVYPAAGFKQIAKHFGAHVTCLNLEVNPNDPNTDENIQGKATEIVPRWCENFGK
ncbi:MAG: NAD-dependent deacylase [Hallerella porci]|uniref:protein acetyllysine N-acetyltransferase n=1 Tax=Hallerella porci TaxID=1945871 RepID=A0ABX5LR18_9BACT|nr:MULTISPECIES: NAD-dependent deacylase [Hallerella]MCI5601661.1 NAD-dependent deacylase [Hallerella sp.]MDY3921049.1 NAD-dependent deacylase [Hallerella porci]PWL03800.1 NAD-dependent deacetylase [Hallerella porci]